MTQLDSTSITLVPPLSFPIRRLPVKRFGDLLLTLCSIPLLVPLLLSIALLIKLTSRGPILFADTRVGRGGKTFRCYKFRTMYQNADQQLQMLLEDRAIRHEWKERRKLRCDPRVTPVGYWLRRSSLDELPQFWNVFMGDMSLVGPRPVTPEEIYTLYGVSASKILRVRPGLTGLWQTSGRSRTSYMQRIALDEQYVEQRSLLLDAKILVKTIPAVLSLRGAY